MQLTYSPYYLLSLLALFVTLFLVHRVWRYRTRKIVATFLVMMFALAWWSLAVVMEHASVELPAKIFWMKLSYVGITAIPIAWLVFTLQYTKREKWLTRRNIVILSILPVITLAMVWTNDLHHLMWKDIWLDINLSPPVNAVTHNIWFWIHAIYAYSLILLGTVCLFHLFWHSSGFYRKQVGIMFLATLVPWAGNFLFIAEISPFSLVDPTPLAFSITGIAFFWGLSRFQLLDIMPIALDAIFASMVDGVIILDDQNRIVELNPAALRIVQRNKSEIIGKLYNQVLPEQVGLLSPKPENTMTETKIAIGEEQSQRHYRVSISPMNKQLLSGHLLLLHDDTERIKAEVEYRERMKLETELIEQKKAEKAILLAEENFHNSVDNSPLGIRIVTEEGETIYANQAILNIFGIDTVDELKTTSRKKFYTPESYTEHQVRKEKRQRGEYIPPEYTISIVRTGGELRHLQVLRREVLWNGASAFEVMYQDITDSRRLESERQRVDKLESIGILAGGIAHDFNNILTAILGNISLGKMKTNSESELYHSLNQAEKATLKAKDLTQQLLAFAKGGAPIKKLASLPELLRETTNFVLHGSNVNCEFAIPDDLWHAEIDEGQISQVINNLVINARQAMPSGGTIKMQAENITLTEQQSLGKSLPLRNGNYIRIAVIDHGTGISEANLDKIFDPFFTTKSYGNGLGLATSLSIVRNHDGHISVESKPDVGSTFYIYLPASTKTEPKNIIEAKKISLISSSKILVMDDENTIREIAGEMLKYLGAKDIQFAANGTDAINLFHEALKEGKPFDVVILDLTIPGGMGGKEAIKKLLELDPKVKAIVSSGYSDESVAKYKEYGFSGVVSKPYTIEDLAKTLNEVVG